MRTDRELMALFAGAIADETTDPTDPTFLDELFEVLVAEVARQPGTAPTRQMGNRLVMAAQGGLHDLARRVPAWTAVAAALLVIVIGSLALLGTFGEVGRRTPQPSSSPAPGATWQVTPATTFNTFTSAAYGYTIGYPSNWQTHASTGQLGSTDYPYDFSGGVDYLSATSPNVLDPGLVIAGPELKAPTDLAGWKANFGVEQTGMGCPAPDATEAATVAGLPAQIETWNACPAYLLWAGFVRGGRAYHVILIDQFATGNPALQVADKAMFLRMLGTFAFTGPAATFGPAPTSRASSAPSPVASP